MMTASEATTQFALTTTTIRMITSLKISKTFCTWITKTFYVTISTKLSVKTSTIYPARISIRCSSNIMTRDSNNLYLGSRSRQERSAPLYGAFGQDEGSQPRQDRDWLWQTAKTRMRARIQEASVSLTVPRQCEVPDKEARSEPAKKNIISKGLALHTEEVAEWAKLREEERRMSQEVGSPVHVQRRKRSPSVLNNICNLYCNWTLIQLTTCYNTKYFIPAIPNVGHPTRRTPPR